MKKLVLFISIAILAAVLQGCSQKDTDLTSKNGKVKVVEFADYKCPYCKKVEDNVMPKLQKDYIDKNKVDYQLVNVAFLGKDSIIGSRAGHAVKNIAPHQYLAFQKKIFAAQPNTEDHKKPWINEKLLDKIIDELNISDQQKADIKKDYKTKDSQSWKDAEKDKKFAKRKNIDTVPVVFVDGTKLDDPYHFKEYKDLLEK
ncbi:DsbA family protein [Staphylococcus debuckii]|uniref:DsbA family protein n=1 Tax=Staphylococcus debuckii TaxID=2044912 RepID=UPI000F42DD90|nr:DsbA family protein [Staphylococcus debuckii]AYU56025.1 DsbA family protein [Staphylococcus debuckii]